MTIPTTPTTRTAPLPPLLVVPWEDPVVDQRGVDPRSTYVETFWLPLLGPTSTWLLRRLADEFDRSPTGFSLDAADAARSIGIGTRGGQRGPFHRSIDRCVRFGMAHHAEHGILAVRRRLPPLSRAQADRLPRSLHGAHADWQRGRRHAAGDHDPGGRRARRPSRPHPARRRCHPDRGRGAAATVELRRGRHPAGAQLGFLYPLSNASSVRTPYPVPPLVVSTVSSSANAGPAMSR